MTLTHHHVRSAARVDLLEEHGPSSLATPRGAKHPTPRTALERTLEYALGQHFLPGNQVTVLRNGDEIFPAMLGAIEEAEHTIDMLTFVYWQGDIADRFAHALSRKARSGVRVRLLLDAVGSDEMPDDLLDQMSEAGVDIQVLRHPVTWRVWRITHRTHRKVLLCDETIGFTGGVGIAEEWTGDAKNPNEWRDTHLRIEGPAVVGLQGAFMGNWIEGRRDAELDVGPAPALMEDGPVRMMTLRSTASVSWSDVATAMWTLLARAEHRLRITTAYFVPDERTAELLAERARAGLEVDILVPGPHTDARVCQLARASVVAPLLEAGVRIHRYQPAMMHAKVLLVDDHLALVGSPNVNHRSLQQDDECCVLMAGGDIIETLDAQFDEDVSRSVPADLDAWEDRPWYRRVVEWLLRPFRVQM